MPRAERLVPPRVLEGSQDVLRAIADRKRRLDAGESREDGLRLGLVAEGGAMRGVVSGGACVGLEDLGLTNVFDVAYGASAGAINLAYFVLGEAEAASRIYAEHAADTRFVNPLRVRRMLDLDWLFENVIKTTFPIPRERLLAAPTDLKVSVTEAETGRNALISVREDVDPYDLLRASAAVPFYYGRRVPLLGREWVDGMASNALPVKEALEDGCTHVLVLLSARPHEGSARASRGALGHDIAWPERLLFLPSHPQGFRRTYVTRRRRLRAQLHLAHADGRVHALFPTERCPVPSRVTRDRVALERAFDHARRRVHELFAPFGLGPSRS